MAQTQVVTTEGMGALIDLWVADMTKIVCLNMATPCTAVIGSTFADPCDTAVHHTDSGLEIAAIDTVAADGAVITFDHVFTATDTKNVAGIHTCNDAGDATYVEGCFAAVIAVENTDTITIDGQVTIANA
jgi:hypothetical protein